MIVVHGGIARVGAHLMSSEVSDVSAVSALAIAAPPPGPRLFRLQRWRGNGSVESNLEIVIETVEQVL